MKQNRTKIAYHLELEETPYLVEIPISPKEVTLADFKNAVGILNQPNLKFFFEITDDDFG